ncbi:hypothetical protein [Clostridium sp. 001]|uniref:hypothetical protein n=1 Tax=Clostridium sp. 001 TaxID=1970093 RepID=UPI001C2B7AE2|nr:hypothetical protein [Clostridium sp. 001]QXE18861.1 hypothetical protein B5S50_08465 [Clostridium sp. 001]
MLQELVGAVSLEYPDEKLNPRPRKTPDRTIMILRTSSLLPEQSILVLKNALGENLKSLSKDEVVALVSALKEGQITNIRLQILINKNSIEVNKILSSLIIKNY